MSDTSDSTTTPLNRIELARTAMINEIVGCTSSYVEANRILEAVLLYIEEKYVKL